MAKGAISKKKRAPSLHSRAARRATSPSIDTDKSLKNVQPPPESVDNRPSIFAIHRGAGVSKKQKSGRAMSSKARKRYEKAQDRAVANMDRLEKKVALSKGQSRTIQGRRKVWEDINQDIPLENNTVNAAEPRGTVPREGDTKDDSELDDRMGEAAEERGSQPGDVDTVGMMRPVTETMLNQDDDDDGIS
ncbi:Alb1-domain-containing protein [Xylaria grammica]|nr:Alb1-domain-containing protein [Xylaria grammica]